MKVVCVYSDGACEGNPGPGGWAAVLTWEAHRKEIRGGDPATTNNRMELQAAIEALRALKTSCEVSFFTDSKYLQLGVSQWLKGWKAWGWRTRDRKPVKNGDLWKALDAEVARHRIVWNWVRGHAGNDLNERCDRLARKAILEVKRQHTPEQLRAQLAAFHRARKSGGTLPLLECVE